MSDNPAQINSELQKQCDTIVQNWKLGEIRYPQALKELESLLESAKQDKRTADEGYIEISLGILYGWRGNYPTSIECFERARDLFVRVENREQVVRCMLNIGESYRLKGNFVRARQFFNTAYKSSVDMKHLPLQITARLNEAQMLISIDHVDTAESALKEAYEKCQQPWSAEVNYDESRRLGSLCEICYSLASIYLSNNNFAEAQKYALESLQAAEETKLPLRLGLAHRIVGEVMTHVEGFEIDGESDPDAHFHKAITYFRQINADGEIARTMFAQGRSLAKRDRSTLAARKLQQAVMIFSRLDMVDDAAKAAEEQLRLI